MTENQALQKEMEQLNTIADDYDWAPFDKAMRHYMMRSLGPHLREGKALEMGCLHGEFTSILAEHYEDLTVVEAAESFIEDTRKRVGPQVPQESIQKFLLSRVNRQR